MRKIRERLALFGVAACLSQTLAMAAHAAPFILYECGQGCDSVDELVTDFDLNTNLNQFPIGTLALLTSAEYPISAAVKLIKAPRRVPYVLTDDDLDAVTLDNRLYARAAKVDPIEIPPSVAGNASGAQWETVEGFVLGSVLVSTGATGFNVFHGFLPWAFGEFLWVQFQDTRDGSYHRIYDNDEITVTFPDGSTAKLYLHPTQAGGHWLHHRPGSERDPNGEPYGENPPSAGGGSGMVWVPPSDWTPGIGVVEALLYEQLWETTICMVKASMSTADGWEWERWIEIDCP